MANRKRRASRSNRRGMVVIAGVVAVLLIGLLMQSQTLSRQNASYEAKKAELEQRIQDEEVRAGEIEEMKEYVKSDEYVEKLAREKLGLVYSDDIIFQPEG